MIKQRIEKLRECMRSWGWNACVISGTDPHSSEYTPSRWRQREFISGFTGSAGTVVVTLQTAGLWTDSRYFIQASHELQGSGVELFKMGLPSTPTWQEWICRTLESGDQVGYDPLCFSVSDYRDLFYNCMDHGILIDAKPDFLNKVWPDRPSLPDGEIWLQEVKYAGQSVEERLSALRGKLQESECEYIILNQLDQISWLFNIRAFHVRYTPVVVSFAVVGMEKATLFMDKESVSDLTEELLMKYGVTIMPYASVSDYIKKLPADGNMMVDVKHLNSELYNAVLDGGFTPDQIVEADSPIALMKSVKNPVEIDGAKQAYLADGICQTRFFHWLETAVAAGERITECDAADMLHSLRSENPAFVEESFETISAYGKSAALPHYTASRSGEDNLIEPHGLYLIDSGAHYCFGTTDITRTMAMGPCNYQERLDYTLVMKSMIALSCIKFPAGTPGCRLDAVARQPLWLAGKNFGHGTGHGVGNLLSVHEGPQDIRQNLNAQPLLEGMITSNEPGLYIEGSHGVRHENMILCRKALENEFGSWLEFDTLTLTYLDTAPLLTELLDKRETEWLNAYNKRVAHTLCPLLSKSDSEWLLSKTRPI